VIDLYVLKAYICKLTLLIYYCLWLYYLYLTLAYTEFSHRLKKCQNQDLEEQVTQTVEALEVVPTVLDETVQFSPDPVALVRFFSPKIHELLNLVTQFIVFHFQHNQTIWLQDHRYWGLLWQHPIQLGSKRFQGNKYSGT